MERSSGGLLRSIQRVEQIEIEYLNKVSIFANIGACPSRLTTSTSGYNITTAPAEGGGFLISYPDFSECISDGETVEEAVANGHDALAATIAALQAKGFAESAPNSGGVASGKFVARVPKTIHAQLATRAKAEGVSLNTLVLTFIAEGLGRREHHA